MFEKKTWEDRITENPGRRKLTNTETGEETTVDVERAEGNVSRVGTSFSSVNMNDLENRIYSMFPCKISDGGTGATTASEARENFGVLTSEILYENSEGTKNTIQLSKPTTRYKILEIENITQDRTMISRIYDPYDKKTTLSETAGYIYYSNDDINKRNTHLIWRTCVIMIYFKSISFLDNSVPNNDRTLWVEMYNTDTPIVHKENDLAISKVIGYKY